MAEDLLIGEMKILRKIIERFRIGYPIGGGFCLLPKTHDNIVLNYGSCRFEIFLESIDNELVIFATNSNKLVRETGMHFDEAVFENGIELLASHYRELGKSVVVK